MDIVLTGTQVYGPATEKSDIDIVLLKEDADTVWKECRRKDIKVLKTEVQAAYGELGGFYFEIGGLLFNIIIAEDKEKFDTWKTATEEMKKEPPFQNRNSRIAFFQRLFYDPKY